MMAFRRPLVAMLLVAVVGSMLGMLAATPAKADDTVQVKMICGFADPAVWNADTEKNAYDTELIITAPTSVAPGEEFTVSVDAEPMKNGPVAIRSAGDAVISAIWNVTGATEEGELASETWENDGPIGVLEEYDIDPLPLTLTAGDSGSVDLEWEKFQLLAIGTITLVCSAFEPDGSGVLLNPTISVTIDGSGGSEDTTTTTEAPDTTTTTTEAPDTTTTSTTEATSEEPYIAQTVTKSVSVGYACATTVSGEEVAATESSQSVMIAAVDKVNSGDDFSVSMMVTPGPANETGATIAAGLANPAGFVVSSDAGSPSPVEVKGPGIEQDLSEGQPIPIPVMQGSIRADGDVGDQVEFTPDAFVVDVPASETTIECEPSSSAPVVLATEIVSEPVDLQNDGQLPLTGLTEYLPFLIGAAAALYFGYLFLSTLPRGRREDGST